MAIGRNHDKAIDLIDEAASKLRMGGVRTRTSRSKPSNFGASTGHSPRRRAQQTTDLTSLSLEAPAAQAFDLALLDVLAVVRRSLAWRELPVIMVTAKSDSRDIVEALDFGADDYVTKPLDFPVALARVRAPLTRVAAERAALTLQRHGDLQKPFGTAAFLAAVRRARVSAAAPKRGRGTQALAMVADSLVPLAKAD